MFRNFWIEEIIEAEIHFDGALWSLKQFLAKESPLRIALYFTLKALFVVKILKFLSLLFGHI